MYRGWWTRNMGVHRLIRSYQRNDVTAGVRDYP